MGEPIADTGELVSRIVALRDPDTDEINYVTFDPPLAGTRLILSDEGEAPSITIGAGVIEYRFEKTE